MTEQENMIDCYKQALQHIIDIGFDNDGFNDIESLKELIQELVSIAEDGLNLKRPQYINGDIVEEIVDRKFVEIKEENYSDKVKEYINLQKQIKEKKESNE